MIDNKCAKPTSTATRKPDDMVEGSKFKSKDGGVFTIINYVDSNKVDVKFESGFITSVGAGAIRKGAVKDRYKPLCNGVGILGSGKHKCWVDGKISKAYTTWVNMLRRCYSEQSRHKFPSYLGCTVYPEWHNFQNFAEWFLSQKNAGHKNYDLDKDLRVLGNTTYGPDYCSIVPTSINNVILDTGRMRGNYPQGVVFHKIYKKFCADYKRYGVKCFIGFFDTAQEAFKAYKIHKEAYVKEVANSYKDEIHEQVYATLMSYTVSELE